MQVAPFTPPGVWQTLLGMGDFLYGLLARDLALFHGVLFLNRVFCSP